MISLVGLHSFTGWDTVSAFNGRGKVKPLKLMVKHVEYMEAFAELGTSYRVSESLLEVLQKFVCHVYGNKVNDIDELRYKLYCQSAGKIGCEYLPPCQDVLRLHARRANHQAEIWRDSLIQYQDELNPEEYGWMVDENGDLDIKWMNCNPAPEEVSFSLHRFIFYSTSIYFQNCEPLVDN